MHPQYSQEEITCTLARYVDKIREQTGLEVCILGGNEQSSVFCWSKNLDEQYTLKCMVTHAGLLAKSAL